MEDKVKLLLGSGMLGIWALGVATYLLRGIPTYVRAVFYRLFVAELTITSHHDVYYMFRKWLEKSGKARRFRSLKMATIEDASISVEGDDDDDDESIKASSEDVAKKKRRISMSAGYGTHYMFYRGSFLRISFSRNAQAEMYGEREQVVIEKLGRNKALFDTLVDEIVKCSIPTVRKTVVCRWSGEYWRSDKQQVVREIDSIFMPKADKEALQSTLDRFNDPAYEKWCISNGIPYQLGILLYGPPGTGKSSLIRAIANMTGRSMAIFNSSAIMQIDSAMCQLSNNAMCVLEDIDTLKSTAARIKEKKDGKKEDAISLVSLSTVLNSIDGVMLHHGRILIMTTNHLEALDAALIRPGRIDFKLELGYATEEVFDDFLMRIFNKKAPEGYMLTPNTTGAELQRAVMLRKSFDEVLEQFAFHH